MLSLEAALLPVVTLSLIKTLYSSWIFCSLFRRPTLSIFGEVFTLEDLVEVFGKGGQRVSSLVTLHVVASPQTN